MDIQEWWDSVKDSNCWSGAIVGLKWSELWDEAKEDIKEIIQKKEDLDKTK